MRRACLYKIILLFLFIPFAKGVYAQVSAPNFNVYNKSNKLLGYYTLATSNKIMIIDNFGTPIFLKNIVEGVLDFNVQEDGYLYLYVTKKKEFYKLDSSYNVIDTLRIKNGFDIDYHELIVRKNGDIYLLGHQYHVMDLRNVFPGGNEFATVVEDVIQVLDKNENVKFEWKSLDHTNLLDADFNFFDYTLSVVDYMHVNSFDVDSNGDIYISARHFSEILKINGVNGDVLWRLGGKNNEFTFLGEEYFSGQHSVKICPNGNLLIFDNGNYSHPDLSFGVEYKIDQVNKVVEPYRKFRVTPDLYVPVMGSIQRFDDGNVVVGWGKNKDGVLLSEYNQNDELILKIESSSLFSYSVTKLNWKTSLFSADQDSINFGNISFNQSLTKKLIVTNNSNKAVQLSSCLLHDTIFKVLTPLPIMLSSKGSVELSVKFAPNRFGGEFYDILTLNFDDFDVNGKEQRVAIQTKLVGLSDDIVPPFLSTIPLSGSKDIPVDTFVEIKFDEPVRLLDNRKLTVDNIKNSFDFVKSIGNEMVSYDITVDSINNKIKLTPLTSLDYGANYILTIHPDFEDMSDNKIDEKQISFTTILTSGLPPLNSNLNNLHLFPNPTEGLIVVNNNDFVDRIDVINANGRVVKTVFLDKQEQINIDITDQSAGIYFVRKTFKSGHTETQKIFKI